MFSKHISNKVNVNTNLIILLHKLSLCTIKTLDNLLYRANLHEVVYPAQTTIAKEVGTTRETINRIIAFLVSEGLIFKTTRPWNTCIYQINPDLNDTELRWELRHLFKSFKMRPLIPLLIIPSAMMGNIKENISFHNHKSHHISSSFPSSSPFPSNLITKEKKDSLQQENRYKKEGQGMQILSEDLARARNFTTLKKDSMNFEELLASMNLNPTDQQFMTIFTLTVVEVMAAKLKEYKTFKDFFEATILFSKTVGQPVDYKKLGNIRAALPKKEFKSNSTAFSTKSESKQVRKPVAWVNTEAVVPERTVEFLELEIEKIKAHDLPTIMTAEGTLFFGLKEKLLTNLEEELAKIKQESIITIEVIEEQPKTQEEKKDSTNSKLDIKSQYEEKYKDHEQADQIRAWLKTVVVDDGNYEEVFD